MMIEQNQMFLGAFGPEQTGIVYTFAKIFAEYEPLRIRSVCTSRCDDGAGSYIMLYDICGDAERLVQFGRALHANPWFQPGGKRVEAAAVVDLKVVAPARDHVLLNALSVISGEHGVNIESMSHRTLLPLLGNGQFGPGPGNDGAGGLGGGGAGDRLGGATLSGAQDGDDPGQGPGGGYVPGGGGPADGGQGTPTGSGTAEEKARSFAARVLGLFDVPGDSISVTHMRLELPFGVKLTRLQSALDLLGEGWQVFWEERPGRRTLSPGRTARAGAIN